MAKITVTYHDLNDDAPRVEQYGIVFKDEKPVEIDTDSLADAPLAMHKWRNNPWFSVKGGEDIEMDPKTINLKPVDPRDEEPGEVEQRKRNEADAEARKKQAETLAKNAEAMKGQQKSQPTPQHKDWRK